jgi:multiple sugar transport system substrate-binding protein
MERQDMQNKKKVRAFAVVGPTVLIASLLSGTFTTAATAADAGMGPGPKVKAATVPVGALIDYSKQPYTPKAYAKTPKVKDGTQDCSYHNTSMKDYKGQTITIMAPPPPNMGEPMEQHGAEFTALTGGKVIVQHVPIGDLYPKQQTIFQTGVSPYDVVVNFSNWIGDFQQYYFTIPTKYTSGNGELASMLPLYKGIYSWNGQTKLFGIDADRHFLKYRTDVIEDPAAATFYKDKTGKALEVPKTWTEYNLIASTFNNYKPKSQPAGVPFAGSVEITKRDDLMSTAFINRVAPYAKNPNVKTGFWFDANMVPQVNNPGFVRGLTEFVASAKYWPQGGGNFGLSDEITSYGRGDGLFSYTWDDAWSQSNQADSPIKGNVKAAPNPGAETVWNSVTKAWETPAGGVNRAPYIAWGWSSAIPVASKNKQMALDFLCFFANRANHAIDLSIGRTGVNPSRTEDFNADFWTKSLGWTLPATQSWIDTLNTYSAAKNRVFDLRVPGNGQFMGAVADGVALALAGQKTPQQALDEVAAKWVEILNTIGKDKVKAAYQNVIKLENS